MPAPLKTAAVVPAAAGTGAVKPTVSGKAGSHRGDLGGGVARKAAGKQGRTTGAKPAGDEVLPPPAPAGPRTYAKGGPTKAECKRYREALLAKRRELLASSKELAAEALQSGGGEFSVDHMADHGSDNYEQDFSLKLLQGEAEQLGEIRDALLKLDGKGELPFGLCEACADASAGKCPTCPWIPGTRLEAIPHARLCVPMKTREEARG